MVSVRLPVELAELLNERAGALQLERSVLLRKYIESGLGNSALDAQIREVVHRMRPIIARTMAEASAEAIEAAAEKLEAMLRERLPSELEV